MARLIEDEELTAEGTEGTEGFAAGHRAGWIDRGGDVAAGALIVSVGAAMSVLGI